MTVLAALVVAVALVHAEGMVVPVGGQEEGPLVYS